MYTGYRHLRALRHPLLLTFRRGARSSTPARSHSLGFVAAISAAPQRGNRASHHSGTRNRPPQPPSDSGKLAYHAARNRASTSKQKRKAKSAIARTPPAAVEFAGV